MLIPLQSPTMYVGRIYLLRVGNGTYVGSTFSTLQERLQQHGTRRGDSRPVCMAIAEHGRHAVSIELLEESEFDGKDDMEHREGLWQLDIKPTLNLQLAGGVRTMAAVYEREEDLAYWKELERRKRAWRHRQ